MPWRRSKARCNSALSLSDDILAIILEHPGIDDAGIAKLLPEAPNRHQQVNSRCRQMAHKGLITRQKQAGQRIANHPASEHMRSPMRPQMGRADSRPDGRVALGKPATPVEQVNGSAAVPATRLGVSFTWQSAGEIKRDADGKLRFPHVSGVAGIYRIRLIERRSVYVGEAVNLRRRMQNYRTPGGNQMTSIWVNAMLLEQLEAGVMVLLELSVDASVNSAGSPLEVDMASKTVRLFAECAAILAETESGWNVINRTN